MVVILIMALRGCQDKERLKATQMEARACFRLMIHKTADLKMKTGNSKRKATCYRMHFFVQQPLSYAEPSNVRRVAFRYSVRARWAVKARIDRKAVRDGPSTSSQRSSLSPRHPSGTRSVFSRDSRAMA